MVRETGIALAMLAVYVLTLLLPLHQAAGLQRDLDTLGFATLDTWSVCQPLAADADGEPDEAAALKCPATGTAKHQLAATLPPAITFALPAATLLLSLAEPAAPQAAILPDHIGQSRAPPAAV
jgi:hypothetical protein